MSINTYEESFTDFLKNNMKTVLIVAGVVVLLIAGFFAIGFFTNNETSGGGEFIKSYNYRTENENENYRLVYIVDLQCPACRTNHATMNDFKTQRKDVQVVYKNFPLPIHTFAKQSAYAAIAAGEQGQYFEYVDRIFALQDQLNNQTLENIATELNLDIDTWNSRRNSSEIRNYIEDDIKDIKDLTLPESTFGSGTKITSTPSTILIKDGEIVDWWGASTSIEMLNERVDKYI
jgi:hypothetical protein